MKKQYPHNPFYEITHNGYPLANPVDLPLEISDKPPVYEFIDVTTGEKHYSNDSISVGKFEIINGEVVRYWKVRNYYNFARGVIKTQGNEEAVRKHCPPVSGLSLEVTND